MKATLLVNYMASLKSGALLVYCFSTLRVEERGCGCSSEVGAAVARTICTLLLSIIVH